MRNTFQLKGGLFPLTTMQLFDENLETLRTQLEEKIKQAPNFFKQAPLVIDLEKVKNTNLDFSKLLSALRELQLIPIGLKNADPAQCEHAKEVGIAILRDSPTKPSNTIALADNEKINQVQETTNPKEHDKSNSTKLISSPVRSGQQICAPDGDLIVTASISPGAEILASGNIHIYGTLRGRALAGINGDSNARIFCNCLAAELVSIAGQYKVSEDIEREAWNVPVQIAIHTGRLQISKI